MNYLEQLVGEWYEFLGYFIRRNTRVGIRPNGGYKNELDVLAFHAKQRELIHIETSWDSDTLRLRRIDGQRIGFRLNERT